MQWARETGRDIIHVDISTSKSMWYGESEKIVKDIFNRYRKLCKRSKLKPILLFNEADAIFQNVVTYPQVTAWIRQKIPSKTSFLKKWKT